MDSDTKRRGTISVLKLSTDMLGAIGMKIHHVEWKEEAQIIEICFDHFTDGDDLFTIKWNDRVLVAISRDERTDMMYDLDASIIHKLIRPVR